MVSVEWDEDTMKILSGVINSIAGKLGRKYRGFVTRDDCVQDAWEFLIKKHELVNDRIVQAEGKKQIREGENYLARALLRNGERIARRAKAQKLGYEVADETFYSQQQIIELLGVMFGDSQATEELPSEVKRKRSGHPSGMTKEAALADIESALLRIDKDERLILIALHGDGMPVARVMREFDLTREQVEKRASRGLAMMVERLGGSNPWR